MKLVKNVFEKKKTTSKLKKFFFKKKTSWQFSKLPDVSLKWIRLCALKVFDARWNHVLH